MTRQKEDLNTKAIAYDFAPNEGDSACRIFSYKPINVVEVRFGTLFILGELTNNSRYFYDVINQVASIVKKEYYRESKRNARTSFEEAVKKANMFLAETAVKKPSFNIQGINFAITAYTGRELYFTACGASKIFLSRGEDFIDISKKLLIERPLNVAKAFANIASGELEKEDYVLMSSSQFLKVFSPVIIKAMLGNNLETSFKNIVETIRKNEHKIFPGFMLAKIVGEKDSAAVRYSYEDLQKISASASGRNTENSIATQRSKSRDFFNIAKTIGRYAVNFLILLTLSIKKLVVYLFKMILTKIFFVIKKIFNIFKRKLTSGKFKTPVLSGLPAESEDPPDSSIGRAIASTYTKKIPEIPSYLKSKKRIILIGVAVVIVVAVAIYFFGRESVSVIK